MKKSIFILFAVLLLTVPAFTQTFTHIQDIDVGSFGTTPQGIAEYNGTLFLAAFAERRVLKIEDPTDGAATVSVFADLTAEYTWATGRGVSGICVDPVSGTVYASGDTGTDGACAAYNQAGTQTAKLDDTGNGHRNSGVALWGASDILLSQVGTGMFEVPATLAATYVHGLVGSSYHRDIVVFGNDVYISFTNNAGGDGVDKFSGGTPGDFASYTATTAWVDYGNSTFDAFAGIFYYDYNGGTPMDYLVCANTDVDQVELYDLADASQDIVLDGTDGITEPTDAVVFNVNGSEYLAVAQKGGAGNIVSIFGIDGATNVQQWDMFE
jgi:hypothetical protein